MAPPIGTVRVTTQGKGEAVGNALTRFTSFFNLTGHPAVSLPCGAHTSGLPMGVQLIGRHFEERTILRAAHALEVQLGWLPRPPAVG